MEDRHTDRSTTGITQIFGARCQLSLSDCHETIIEDLPAFMTEGGCWLACKASTLASEQTLKCVERVLFSAHAEDQNLLVAAQALRRGAVFLGQHHTAGLSRWRKIARTACRRCSSAHLRRALRVARCTRATKPTRAVAAWLCV